MGKGVILENLGEAKYRVELKYGGRDRIDDRIEALNEKISELQTKYAGMPEGTPAEIMAKNIVKMQITALQKQVQYLENSFPADPKYETWCVDYSDELTGEVATIEIPGERQAVLIMPGFKDGAAYRGNEHGILEPAIASGPWTSLYNQILLPAWQKWKPTFRLARIIPGTIDHGAGTCNLFILPAFSSQQRLDVNQGAGALNDQTEQVYYESSGHPGWDDFKTRYPSHAMVVNTEDVKPFECDWNTREAIRLINYEVNEAHDYETDFSGIGVGDRWDIMGIGDRGDCEDFALTKCDRIISETSLGADKVQLILCYDENGEYHCVAGVPTINRGTLVLDNRFTALMTKDLLDNYYRWDQFLINGNTWAYNIRQVYSIPIEYMNCGSSVFQDDDLVVVQFEEQNWDQPKVIGFATDPRDCGTWFYHLLGWDVWLEFYQDPNWRLNMITKAHEMLDKPTSYPRRFKSSAAVLNNTLIIMGGYGSQALEALYLDRVEQFVPVNSWILKQSYPTTAACAQANFVINNKVDLIAGGRFPISPSPAQGGQFVYFQDHNQYDLTLDAWQSKQIFPKGKWYGLGCNLNDKGHVISGAHQNFHDELGQTKFEPVSGGGDNYQYDPASDSWLSKKKMNVNRGGGSLFSIGEDAYVNGGYADVEVTGDDMCFQGFSFTYCLTYSMEKYNQISDTWAFAKRMPAFVLTLPHPDPGEDGGGGTNPNYDRVAFAWQGKGYQCVSVYVVMGEYDPATDSWSIFWERLTDPTPGTTEPQARPQAVGSIL